MLSKVFPVVLDMSLRGSLVISVLLAFRAMLRRAPKVFSYWLWLAAFVALLCPFTIKAPVGIIPEMKVASDYYQAEVAPFPDVAEPIVDAVQQPQTDLVTQDSSPRQTEDSATLSWMDIFRYSWLFGIAGFVTYGGISYFCLRRKLIGAMYQDGIYLSDHIGVPFVMGVLRPKIYLPSSLKHEEYRYIVTHERCHIRRGDHVVKLIAYATLSIHWFNPVVWLMYHLLCKDMEMCCDEAVLRKLGEDLRADYAQSLLHFAAGRDRIGRMPLAFGEGDTKGRIRNMYQWRKPKLWIMILTALLVTGVMILLILCPRREDGAKQRAVHTQPQPSGVSVEKAFQAVLSHAGFDPDSRLYTDSLNATTLAQSDGQTHLPVFCFETRENLDQFIDTYADGMAMTEGYEEVPSFASIAERYDDSLFEENSVLLLYIRAVDSTCRYKVLDVRSSGYRLDIRVCKIKDSHNNPGDVTGWFLTMAVPDSMLQGVERVDATMEEARTTHVPRIEQGEAVYNTQGIPVRLTYSHRMYPTRIQQHTGFGLRDFTASASLDRYCRIQGNPFYRKSNSI